jgi:fatty-acyl-CoA synthase
MSVTTIPVALAAAAAARQPNRILLLGPDASPTREIPFDELHDLAGRTAVGLLEAGLRPRDHVFLILPTGAEFFTSFFGCILAGVIPCPVSRPQGDPGRLGLWVKRLRQLVESLDVRAVLTEGDLAAPLAEALGPDVPVLDPARLMQASGTPPPSTAGPEDIAFLQLTSGTTGLPRGVRISHRAVAANTRQIAEGSGMVAGSVMVSWLPLFHDMGLVGASLTPVYTHMDLVLMSPFQFLRRPQIWLRAFGRYRGTHSPAPTFSYRYVVDRLSDADVSGLDLSTWEVAFIGAEPIHPEVLRDFERRLRPAGLSETTLLPCYGLAESSLAVAFKPLGTAWRTIPASRRGLSQGRWAAPGTSDSPSDDRTELVSCGVALPGTEVWIEGEGGRRLAEGEVGEIVLRGDALFSGYHGDPPLDVERGFTTGDLGFLQDGELFVLGRRKEVIILSGENHHPAEVEWAAGQVEGLRRGRIAAFGIFDPAVDTEQLCLLAEVDPKKEIGSEALEAEVRRQVREATGLVVSQVELVPSGTLTVTTSGKLQRLQARETFLRARAGAGAEESAVADLG